MNLLCCICSDLLQPHQVLHVTTCGHAFHFSCLYNWLTRSKSCPHCRNRVTLCDTYRFFPTTTADTPQRDEDKASQLQIKLDHTILQLHQKSQELRESQEINDITNAELNRTKNTVKSLEQVVIHCESAKAAQKETIKILKAKSENISSMREKLELCEKELQTLNGVRTMLDGSVEDLERMLEGYTDVRTIALFATALKKALFESESKNRELRVKLQAAKAQLTEDAIKYSELEEKYNVALAGIESVDRDLEERNVKNYEDEPYYNEITPCSLFTSKLDSSAADDENISDNSVIVERDTSLNTMIERIENADSPYLNLKQNCITWANMPTSSKAALQKVQTTKISTAYSKASRGIEVKEIKDEIDNNVSYDGLGGHAPCSELLPKPRTNMPKITAKHRLKRPNSDGVPKLTQFLKKQRPTNPTNNN